MANEGDRRLPDGVAAAAAELLSLKANPQVTASNKMLVERAAEAIERGLSPETAIEDIDSAATSTSVPVSEEPLS